MTYQLLSPKIEQIAIRVIDLEKMVQFYRQMPGFYLLSEENNLGFFSTHKHQPAFLIIEDTPFGSRDSGPVRKLAQVRFSVNDLGQFRKMMNYLDSKGVTYAFDETKNELQFADLEGNQLVFVLTNQPEQKDLIQLARLDVNVIDETASTAFFNQLGIDVQNDLISLNQKAVTWDNTQEVKRNYVGLDFVKLNVEKTELQHFVDHLNKIGLDFYTDPHNSIITLFDPNGVEWWITTAKKRKND